MNDTNQEIEVRFLEVDVETLKSSLKSVGAQNLGEERLEEIIFYDKELVWKNGGKQFIRLRKNSKNILLCYKSQENNIDGTEEIEFAVSDFNKATLFLDRAGFTPYRHQEKKRHSYHLDGVTIEIDTWPKIPTYVELEGDSENALRVVASKLGFDWKEVVFDSPKTIIEDRYNIPVGHMTWFTFDRFE